MPLIRQCHVSHLQKPLLTPFRIATGVHNSLDNVLLTITLDNGISGYGEAAVATHITGETIDKTIANLKAISQFLKGKDPAQYLQLAHVAGECFADNKAALAAVEMALLDSLSKQMKIPLWRLWGDQSHSITTDITIVIGSLEETQVAMRAYSKAGFRAFKVKIGCDRDLDFKRIEAVRKISPRASIILDANQGYTSSQMLAFLKDLKKARISIDLLEQPVAKSDIEGLCRVARLGGVPVCADESARSLKDVMALINRKAVHAINIKLMKTGIIESVAIARWAKACGLKLMIGGMMETSLAMTCAAHLACGLRCFDYVDLDTPFFIKDEQKRNRFLSSRGHYRLDAMTPGIGIRP